MSQIDQDILEAFLKTRQPHNMLLIGPQAQWLVDMWCRANPACEVTRIADAAGFSSDEYSSQFEFSVLAGALGRQPRAELEQLIAGLRDRYSRQLVVQLDPTPTTNDDTPMQPGVSELRALGLRQIAGSERLFQFNLDDYKLQPDWLNSQYWANPQRWNKDRW